MKKVKKVSKVSGRFDHKGAPKHIKDVLNALKQAEQLLGIIHAQGNLTLIEKQSVLDKLKASKN